MNYRKPLPVWSSLVIIVIISLSAGLTDEDTRYVKIRDALNKFTYLYHQQKVYLHLDKAYYYGGDDLWIKAYVVNGTDHLPDTMSTNLYVELISPFQTRVEIKRFQMFTGFGIGDFHLSDTLPEGLYQIRAYTPWMQNFSTEYYFKKNFQVINHNYRKIISPKQARLNTRELEKVQKDTVEVDLQFMPEGGYMVNNIESTIAFKAVNKLGKGVDIEGIVSDNKGRTVSSFKSYYKGIGTFTMKPEADTKYTAIVRYGRKEIRVPLPDPLETGLVMHVENLPNSLMVHFMSNKQTTHDPTANELIVTGQLGGLIYYHEIVRLETGKADLEIQRSIFPGGVMQLTAFSGRGVPLAERLVFVNFKGNMKINFWASDTLTPDGNKIAVDIRVKDSYNHPLRANLSLSVTREVPDQFESNRDNIVSSLLLSSDLLGYVEDPLEYFKSSAVANALALDNLMLTQGWRRFEWDHILAGDFPKIRYQEEKNISISGRITREFFNIPLKNCQVRLSIMDEFNDVFTQYSSDKGYFEFNNLVYYDTVSVKIEAWKPSGRKNLLIVLFDEKNNEVTDLQGEYVLTTLSERNQRAYRLEQFQKYKTTSKLKEEELAEERSNTMEGFYGEPDYVLYSEDFHTSGGNILDVIKGRVPGVQVTGDNVHIRGVNSILGGTQPLYLIDGVPVQDVNVITDIPIEDVERVEILKGPSTSFYGLRGSNGVIAIYTKRGRFLIKGVIEFDMLCFHAPRRFYQPKYTPEQEPPDKYTLLWEPVILTNDQGVAKIVFDKPTIQGNYLFDIQGISYMGHAGFTEAVISNQL